MSGRIDDFEFSIMRTHAVVERYYGKSTDVIIPEEFNGFPVTHIAVDCFFNSKITSVVGKSIKSVGYSAFKYCTNLTSVDFPACSYIGNSAFQNCTSLTSIDLPICNSIGSSAFYSCTSLTEINLPACEDVSNCAFQMCTSLTNIELPVCLAIGSHAFNWCTSLTNIDFPVCYYFGENAFAFCTSLIKKGKYKATNTDLTCRDFHYEIGKWFKEDEAVLCKKGFHYVENFYDIFNYYWGELRRNFRIFEVEAEEISDERRTDSKRVCKKIKLVNEITSYKDFF